MAKGGNCKKVSLRMSFTRAIDSQPLDKNSARITGWRLPGYSTNDRFQASHPEGKI